MADAPTLADLAVDAAFATALDFTLREEGVDLAKGDYGFVNDPLDPGGATKAGITQAEYSAWCASFGRAAADVAAMPLTEIVAIYRARYWRDGKCDRIAMRDRAAAALAHFDWGVNGGISRAARYLQSAVGTVVDGVIGPATLMAVADADETAVCERYCQLRAAHYHLRAASEFAAEASEMLDQAGLASVKPVPNASQQHFLKGWLKRVQRVAAHCGVTTFDRFYAEGAWVVSGA